MKNIIGLALTLALTMATAASGFVREELEVQSNLSGEVRDIEKKELVLTFFDDMVALGGKRPGADMVSISPRLKGEFLWRGSKTLVFKPAKRFAYSTRYRVTVKKGVRSLSGRVLTQERHWEFKTPLAFPVLVKVGEDFLQYLGGSNRITNMPTTTKFTLMFHQRVAVKRLKKYLTLFEAKSGQALPFRLHQVDESRIEVSMDSTWKYEARYGCVIKKGWRGEEGDLEFLTDLNLEFNTISFFRYKGPAARTLWLDQRIIDLPFSEYVNRQPKEGVSVQKKVNDTWEPYAAFRLLAESEFLNVILTGPVSAGSEFRILLDQNFTSLKGNPLAKSEEIAVTFCPAMPAFYLDNRDMGVNIHLQNIQSMDLVVYQFKNDLFAQIASAGRSFWQGMDMEKNCTNVRSLTLHPGYGEMQQIPLPLFPEGSRGLGLFGVCVSRFSSYNQCQDREITTAVEKYSPKVQLFHLRNTDFVVRSGRGGSLFWVYDNQSGEPIPGANIFQFHKGKRIPLGVSGADGLLLTQKQLETDDIVMAENIRKDDRALCLLEKSDEEDEISPESYSIQVFTDRNIYQPGDAVHIAGVVKLRKEGRISTSILKKAYLYIISEDDELVWKSELELDPYGGFHALFPSRKDLPKGDYEIFVRSSKWKEEEEDLEDLKREGRAYFQLDYYQPDRIKMEIHDVKDKYRKNDPFNPVISGVYLSGNPMAADEISIKLHTDGPAGIIPLYEKELQEYRFDLESDFQSQADPLEKESRLDSEGKCLPVLNMKKFGETNFVALCRMIVTGETREGKEFNAEREFIFIPGERLIGIKAPYFVKCCENIQIDLVMLDGSLQAAEGRADITVFRNPDWGYSEKSEAILEKKDVLVKGRQAFNFRVEKPGSYLIKCDARDADGKTVSTSAEFFVSGYLAGIFGDKELEIKTDKPSYRVGETARLQITSPLKGRVLVTVEQGKILDRFVMDTDQAEFFELPVKKEYFQFIRIHALVLDRGGHIESAYKNVEIGDDEKKLQVELLPQQKEIKPASASRVRVKVKDQQGRGRKARAFVYAVDEGTLQLSGYATPALFDSFYYYYSDSFFCSMYNFFSRDDRIFDLEKRDDRRAREMGIGGKVTDWAGNPLAGVLVTITGKKAVVTNEQGYFLLTRIPLHFYFGTVLSFQKDGYADQIQNLKSSSFRSFEFLHVVMEKKDEPKKPETAGKGKGKLFDARGFRVCGKVTDPEGSPLPGVTVSIYKKDDPKNSSDAISDEQGNYCLRNIPRGTYELEFALEGFKNSIRIIEVAGSLEGVHASMQLGALNEEVTVCARPPSILASENNWHIDGVDITQFQNLLRRDFREVLFFEQVETDENGDAEVGFLASDQISTYRVMAVAYDEDRFGSAEASILVSKKVLLDEAMPEFARTFDRFRAGVQVGNRTDESLQVTVAARTDTMKIAGAVEQKITLAPRSNEWVQWDFLADRLGESEINFYALSNADRDALQKKLPVSDHLVFESLVDFDSGASISKRIQPLAGVEKPMLKLKVAPSILKPGLKVAEKLIFYPYECLEQRTSKVMPYLVLDEEFIKKMDLPLDQKQIAEAIEGFIKIIPEFRHGDGGLSYYRGSDWASDYLTLYVLWSLKLAEKKHFNVDAGLVQGLEEYLHERTLGKECQAFYQFILSLDGKADHKVLDNLFNDRMKMSIWGRAFLYRAVNCQQHDREKLQTMLAEFMNGLQVESDFAYFDVREFTYIRDIPFYSSRFATALLLQAVLEVEGGHSLAPRFMNWLLSAEPHEWNTTQTNFWILAAMNEYVKRVEKGGAARAEVQVLDEKEEKVFQNIQDDLKMEKDISGQKDEFTMTVKADQMVYLTTEMRYAVSDAGGKSRGIRVQRHVYDEAGKEVRTFERGKVYQVELLLDCDKEVPFVVIDEPLAAGFEQVRTDLATSRETREFNLDHEKEYSRAWLREEHAADRVVFYSYWLPEKVRIVYFIKALYEGEFTWLPAAASGMYHPQYSGRCSTRKIIIHPR